MKILERGVITQKSWDLFARSSNNLGILDHGLITTAGGTRSTRDQ
jgi:hypothetical protein